MKNWKLKRRRTLVALAAVASTAMAGGVADGADTEDQVQDAAVSG
jgi:hypothetical protein